MPDSAGPALTEVGYLKAANAGAGDHFGFAVSISEDGSTMAISAPQEASAGLPTDDSAPNAGAVYVFARSGSSWTQQAYLKASNVGASDNFGVSISLSADGATLAVGASGEASGIVGNPADNSAPFAGAVYVFERSGLVWSQVAYVKASNVGAGDVFGVAVALSGDGTRLAVGAAQEDSDGTSPGNNSFSAAGAVYVFRHDGGGTWIEEAYLKAQTPDINDQFGRALAISDDGGTLAVGVRFESSNATGVGGDQNNDLAPNSGAVYVFTRAGTLWSPQAFIKATNTRSNDEFGLPLGLSGDGSTLAVSARLQDGATLEQNDITRPDAGAVYVYTRESITWSFEAYIKPDVTGEGDAFGGAMTMTRDGATLVTGSRLEDSASKGVNGDANNDNASGSGSAYVFTRSGTTWTQTAYLKASNTEVDDTFGDEATISRDGSTIVVLAPNEDSNGSADDNSLLDSGAGYVFQTR